MTLEEYNEYCLKAMKMQDKNIETIQAQIKMGEEVREKAKKYYEFDDMLNNLYIKGFEKYKEKNNTFITPEGNTKLENLEFVTKMYINQSPELKTFLGKMNEIPELKEAGELEKERENLFFDYAIAHLKLDAEINKAKKELFSAEYLEKMDEYAQQGVMLYFLETPDLPLLDSDVTPQMILEASLFDECTSLKEIYKSFIECPCPGISMQRKITDVIDVFNNLINGCFRTAARTIFALLESEIKNIATALERFFEKENNFKNGKQRSNKIEEITKYMDVPNAVKKWKSLNGYYEKIVTGKDAMIDRNKIIHGDYADCAMDINEYDVVKLLLLYISIRNHGDYIQNHINLYENALIYFNASIANELKKIKK